MADVFLSYAHEDREKAEQLADALSASWSVWWDRAIPTGETWAAVVGRELNAADVVVVLWSEHSRIQGSYVREEAAEAREQRKLVPACLDAGKPPFGFREVQAANLADWDGLPGATALAPLAKAISGRVAPRQGPRVSESAAIARPEKQGSLTITEFEKILRRHVLAPVARVRAVDDLSRLKGGPRFRPDAWSLPADPLLGFIEIPAGPFTMGSDPAADKGAHEDEQPAHAVMVSAFYVARFPVTVAQFKACADEAGVSPSHPDCLRGVSLLGLA